MVSITPSALETVSITPLPASKSLPGRPSSIRKRDSTHLDLADDAIPSSPGKRPKVKFDTDVEVQVMGDWEKDPELIREEVRRAVVLHARGENAGYDRVTEIFTTEPTSEDAPNPTTVRNYMLALLGSVASLNKSCSGLVHAVLESQWLGRDEGHIALYIRFLGALSSAQGGFVGTVLRMLVDNFSSSMYSRHLKCRTNPNHPAVPLSNGQLPDYPSINRTQLYARAHLALKYLLQLIPSASGLVSPILAASFPPSTDSSRAHVAYVRNLLKIIEYAPELRSDILVLITERLIKIDLQVQEDLENLEEEVDEGLVEDVSKLQMAREGLDDLSGEEDEDGDESIISDEGLDEEAQRKKEVKSNIDKVDAILDILFAYYQPFFTSRKLEEKESTLELLLSHFATIILPTYHSRYTQFLLFHFAQTTPALIDHFAGTCVHIAFDKVQPAIIRRSAAAYLGSFVARGKHIPSRLVQDVFDIIGDQLHILLTEYEPLCRGPDLRRYATFYALVQALLYIFCFRWRDLTVDADSYADADSDDDAATAFEEKPPTWAAGVKEILHRAIHSPLNPLKVCSPAIVAEFANIAHRHGLIYVYSRIETNKRLRLSHFTGSPAGRTPGRETALSVKNDESLHQLDAYFPFDPYRLPRSKKWIEGDYVDWEGVPEDKDDGNVSDSDSDEEMPSDVEEDQGTGTGTGESD